MNFKMHTRFLLLVNIGLSSMFLAGCTATLMRPVEEVEWRAGMFNKGSFPARCWGAAYQQRAGLILESGSVLEHISV